MDPGDEDPGGILFKEDEMHWLYFCEALLLVTLALVVIISLVTHPPKPDTVKYTY